MGLPLLWKKELNLRAITCMEILPALARGAENQKRYCPLYKILTDTEGTYNPTTNATNLSNKKVVLQKDNDI